MTRQGKNPASPLQAASSTLFPPGGGQPATPGRQPAKGDTSSPTPLSDEDKEIEELVEKMIANRRRRMKRR
jgi:hypothetical protein